MPEISVIDIVISALGGAFVGFLFFGGLWLTVRAIGTARHPAGLAIASSIVRIVGFVAAFYLIARFGNWVDLVVALAAAIIVRTILVRKLGYKNSKQSETESTDIGNGNRS